MTAANESDLPADDDSGLTRRRKTSNARWMVFWLASGASFLTYVHRYTWGVIRPYIKEELGLIDSQLGWLDSAFNLTYALCQFPGGLVGDVLGPRLIIPIAAVLWSFAMVGPAHAKAVWQLAAVRLGFGITQAASYPNLGKVTKSWFPISIRTSVQGFVASLSGRAGGACSSIILSTFLIGYLHLSWRVSLYVLGLFGIVFAVLFWFFFRNTPQEHPWVNDAERELIESGDAPIPGKRGFRFDWSRSKRRNLLFFLAASFCSSFADNLFVMWMPQFLYEEKGFGAVELGIFASLPLWGGAVGGLCGGFLNDAAIRITGNRRLARSLIAVTGKTLAAILIVVSLAIDDGRLIMIALLLCKFFSDWTQPTWWGTVTDIGGPAAGRVFGMVNTFGSIGATVAGFVMGYVKQGFGFTGLFYFVAGVYVVTAICWAFVDCTKKLVVDAPPDDE